MEYALIYVIVAILAGAFTGAMVTTWQLKLHILRVETRLVGLEERQASLQTREAAKSRWSKRDQEQEAILSQFGKNKRQAVPDDGPYADIWPPL
jgi:glycerol uptake facilitator-like aquaporin